MTDKFKYRKANASNPSQACVEVALNVVGVAAIRDSKDRQGPHLEFAPSSFTTFLAAVKSGNIAPS